MKRPNTIKLFDVMNGEELATLQALGIPYGQGYLFGRAAPLRRAR